MRPAIQYLNEIWPVKKKEWSDGSGIQIGQIKDNYGNCREPNDKEKKKYKQKKLTLSPGIRGRSFWSHGLFSFLNTWVHNFTILINRQLNYKKLHRFTA